jgi:predicted ATPase/class 3 adenylate cyclase
MPTLEGYELGDVIHDRPTTQVRRAVRQADGQKVIVKLLTEEYPSERTLAAVELAYTIGRKVACDSVISHLALEKFGNGLAVVTEDFGARSLDTLGPAKHLGIAGRLRIGVAVAKGLAQVHARNVIHKDVKPHNVVMNFDTGVIKLIDFGIASQLTREHPSLKTPGKMEGTLGYVSPEQTGRMNRSIDSRSDLYSLGVTLYELFCGRLPFLSRDPLALIHGHLARLPDAPSSVDPSVPEAVSALIMKLLSKAPEDRYQTAYGVQQDLEALRQRVLDDESLDGFELGTNDVSSRFVIPQKLYGREAEATALLDAFGRASAGARELFLVAGYSGIGKSALIQEIYRPITEHRGWYCAGKFDQFRRDIPYAALIAALRDLMRQLLTESDERIAGMKERLLAALGDNGAVIIDVVPELEAVIGPQAAVPDVGPTEGQNRFNNSFKNFIRVFARPEHPLTLFIDDLQWADVPSLKLLEVLVTDPAGSHLFVVGAYRDNEVYEGHALLDTIGSISEGGQPPTTITLTPLGQDSITEMVAETLGVDSAEAGPVAELLFTKTGGNPFFVKELLGTLYKDGLLTFDAQERRWRWELAALRSVGITDNVVELVAAKLQSLEPATISVLQHAACIGSSFDLRTLAQASELTLAQTAMALDAALADGFVLPLDDDYKYMGALQTEGGEQMGTAWYRFLHDRVHQAAYSLLSEDERKSMHLRTGQILWGAADEAGRSSILMDVANHFDMAKDLLTSPEQRDEVARIVLEAGNRAKGSMAFAPAAHYLATGLELLPDDSWTADYPLALAMHTSAAEAEFLNSRYDAMEGLIDAVIPHCTSWLDEANVQAIRVKAKIAQGLHHEALECAFGMLDRVDVVLPRDPQMDDIMAGYGMAKAAIADRTMEQLLELDRCEDPEKIVAMELLMSAAPSAYFVMPNNFLIINFHLVKLSVEAGFSVPSVYGYVVFGMINSGIFGDTVGGYGFGRLAWDLLDRHNTQEQIGRAAMIWGTFVGHWTDHAQEGAKIMFDKFRAAAEVGDLEHATYSVLQSLIIETLVGRTLDTVAKQYQEPVEWVNQAQQAVGIALVAPYYQAVLNLRDKKITSPRLTGDLFDWDAGVQAGYDGGFTMLVAYSSVAQAQTAVVFGDWELAEKALDHAEKTADQLTAHYGLVCTNFYRSLCRARRAREAEGEDRDALLAQLAEAQTQLDTWAKSAPTNHRHKHTLIEAEIARTNGDGMQAMQLYQGAIDGARSGGFINEEAMACERLAEHCADGGLPEMATYYIGRAQRLYARWGARGKVAAMRESYGDRNLALATFDPDSTGEFTRPASGVDTAGISTSMGEELDLDSFMKAGRTISGEIDLEKLLSRVMALVLENAGADRGALLLTDEDGQLRVEAQGAVDDAPTVLQSTPVGESMGLPISLVEYCRRANDNVVLHDAGASELFGKDPHIVVNEPRSILAAPLSNQGKLTGVIYLENSLSTSVFTQHRVDVVEMLCAQAAISIENSRLFAEQKLQAESFARFVPQQFLQHLGRKRITDVQLGDSSAQAISVMFSDLRGFTTLSEGMKETELFPFLNGYLEAMQPAIGDNEGFIDKFIGDAVMALFPGDTANGVRAGIGMQRALEAFNRLPQYADLPELKMGIGLHCGPLVLGTVGSPKRMETTVIGDTVNLASRIEGACKMFHAQLLVTSQMLEGLGDGGEFTARCIGRLRVKGKTEPATVYEILEGDPEELGSRKRGTLVNFHLAINAYFEGDFDSAATLFKSCADAVPEDRLAVRYAAQCSDMKHMGGAPADWDGVTTLSSK